LSADQFTSPRPFYFIELQDWSPDGTKIVFTYYTPPEKGQKEDFEIYLYDLNTKETRKVLDGKTQESIAQLSKVTISPDNQFLVLDGAVSTSTFQIFLINVDGTGLQQLTKDNQFSVENPVWSPQGSTLFVNKRTVSGSMTTALIDAEGQDLLSVPSVGIIFEWIR
jgi:Tol biopolymer transport system component